MSSKYSFMVVDLRRCASLVWSCAYARALQEHTKLEWQPYRESTFLNAAYSLLFWKGAPGTAEVRQDRQAIDAKTRRYFDHTFHTLLQKSHAHGPVGLVHYVNGLVESRAYCLNAVQQVFRDSSSINSEIAGQTEHAIKTLAKIKLTSTLALTGMTCSVAMLGGSAVLLAESGAIKLGADVIGEIVKPHEHIGTNVKGVAYQLAKYEGEKGSDKAAEAAKGIGEKALGEYGPKLAAAQRRIERYSYELFRKFGRRKAARAEARLLNAKADKAVATRAVESAERTIKVAKFAGKAVPLVFAAWDVYDAWQDYKEDTATGE